VGPSGECLRGVKAWCGVVDWSGGVLAGCMRGSSCTLARAIVDLIPEVAYSLVGALVEVMCGYTEVVFTMTASYCSEAFANMKRAKVKDLPQFLKDRAVPYVCWVRWWRGVVVASLV